MIIQTKYNIGDKVYFIYENEVASDTIWRIHVRPISDGKDINIYYDLRTKRRIGKSADVFQVELKESKLFPSKQDLLNSL